MYPCVPLTLTALVIAAQADEGGSLIALVLLLEAAELEAVTRIKEALDWIATDITRDENDSAWAQRRIEPDRSRIELFRHGVVDVLPEG